MIVHDELLTPIAQCPTFIGMGVVAETESILLDQGLNCVLASDVLSPIDVPAADNSAINGFVFRGAKHK